MKSWMVSFVVMLVLAITSQAWAVPLLINYQGRLLSAAGQPVSGTRTIHFALYTAAFGGSALWQENQSVSGITDGVVNVQLGSVTTIPAPLAQNEQLWLGITVAEDPEMTPRAQVSSVVYSLRTDNADKLQGKSAADITTDINSAVGTHAALTATHGVTGSLVGTSDTQALSNKTLDAATLTEQSSIPSTPSSGKAKLYAKNDKYPYYLDSDGTVMDFVSGWIPAKAVWTRTGNFTFTVPGDLTAAYQKGTRVRYKDGGAFEYGVVAGSAYSGVTTVTLASNNDFAMAAATVTENAFSYSDNPQGYPDWFNYTPGFGVGGANGITVDAGDIKEARFSVKGRTCYLAVDVQTFTITHLLYNYGYLNISTPITPLDVNTGSKNLAGSTIELAAVLGPYWANYNGTEFKNIAIIGTNTTIYLEAPSDATNRTDNCYLQVNGSYQF